MEDPGAARASDAVPDAVGENRGEGRDRDGDAAHHLAHAGERSDAEQRGDRRQRHPDLLEEDEDEQDQIAVVHQKA